MEYSDETDLSNYKKVNTDTWDNIKDYIKLRAINTKYLEEDGNHIVCKKFLDITLTLSLHEKQDKMLSYVENLKVEREKIYEKLLDMGVKAYKSGANFVFFSGPIDNLAEKLIDNDVLIRKFGGKLDNHYRVTVGSPKENEAFLNAMKKIV